jgi:hypothetical protein
MSGAATFTQDGSIPTRRCSTTPSDTAKNSNDEIRTIRGAVIIQQIETVSVFISRGFFDSLNDRFALCPTGRMGTPQEVAAGVVLLASGKPDFRHQRHYRWCAYQGCLASLPDDKCERQRVLDVGMASLANGSRNSLAASDRRPTG